jgi:hypothetical protein
MYVVLVCTVAGCGLPMTCAFTLPLSTPILLQLSLHKVNCSVFDERENGAPGDRLVRGGSASDEPYERNWRSCGQPLCRRNTRVLRKVYAIVWHSLLRYKGRYGDSEESSTICAVQLCVFCRVVFLSEVFAHRVV